MSYHGLVLPPEAAARVAAGARDLPWPRGAGTALEPGRPLRLVRADGQPLGLALADPENERLRLLARADEPFVTIGPDLFEARVRRALALRRTLGLTAPRAAYRALHGAGDGLPGFAADVLGDFAVLSVPARALLGHGRAIAEQLVDGARLRGCVVKLRSRGAASQGRVRQELVGEEPPRALVVEEQGVPFEVHLDRGMNTGLFTDMREQRHFLASLAAGKRVLNGFSYTGTLSVVAARSGASAVTSVDLSAGVHGWARDNLRLSGLDPDAPAYRFEASDVGAFLDRARREAAVFDLVLLDPPAFSAARGAPFAIDRDYPEVIARAAELVSAGGLVWLACNARGSVLLELAARGFATARRRSALLSTGGLPADHPTLPAQPEDRYLQAALFHLD